MSDRFFLMAIPFGLNPAPHLFKFLLTPMGGMMYHIT
jgi:hypothetical protein